MKGGNLRARAMIQADRLRGQGEEGQTEGMGIRVMKCKEVGTKDKLICSLLCFRLALIPPAFPSVPSATVCLVGRGFAGHLEETAVSWWAYS